MPISKDGIESRLHLANWPLDLNDKMEGAAFFAQGIDLAREGYDTFRGVLSTCLADGRFTAAGRKDALRRAAEKIATKLLVALPKVGEHVAALQAERDKLVMHQFARPVKDSQDMALMQEVRAYLRSLPEKERRSLVDTTARAGDRTALRAALLAPDYLSGMPGEETAALREFLFDQSNLEFAANFASFNKAASILTDGVHGLIEYMGDTQEAQRDPPALGLLSQKSSTGGPLYQFPTGS